MSRARNPRYSSEFASIFRPVNSSQCLDRCRPVETRSSPIMARMPRLDTESLASHSATGLVSLAHSEVNACRRRIQSLE